MLHTGNRAAVISLGIGDGVGIRVGTVVVKVRYVILLGADEVGIQHHVSCNGGIDIKGNESLSGPFHPAAVPGTALGLFYILQVIRVDFLAVRNFKCFGITDQSDVHMDLSCLHRSSPLGVNHTVTGGHGGQLRRGLGAGLAGGRGVPALEHIVGIHSLRSFGGVGRLAGGFVNKVALQGSLILDGLGFGRFVYVVELEVVAIADVVELGAVVAASNARTYTFLFILRETGNVVKVLF